MEVMTNKTKQGSVPQEEVPGRITKNNNIYGHLFYHNTTWCFTGLPTGLQPNRCTCTSLLYENVFPTQKWLEHITPSVLVLYEY